MQHNRILIGTGVVVVAVALGAVVLSGDDDGGDGGSEDDRPVAQEVAAEDNAFGPESFTVVEGEFVRFLNSDDVPHTFTADDGLFDSGTVEPGDEFRYAFDGPVTVTYHCEIHPSMTGTVEVTAE